MTALSTFTDYRLMAKKVANVDDSFVSRVCRFSESRQIWYTRPSPIAGYVLDDTIATYPCNQKGS